MDYASNSHKSKGENKVVENPPAEKKVVKQVATGVRKKKGFGKKLAESFIQNDVQNVKSYIVDDVVIPGIKKAIMDAILPMPRIIPNYSAARKRGRKQT